MPDIEPIIRRKFSRADRAAIEEQVSRAVEADPERSLAAYVWIRGRFKAAMSILS
jgi:hypothetical protein